MQSRGSGPRPFSRISSIMLSMFATMASFYVAGRSILLFRHQQKKLAALEMELAAARHEGFVGQYSSETNGTYSRKRLLVVIGIVTEFGRKKHRDAVRKSWLSTGAVSYSCWIFFACSANHGDSLDREIDDENSRTKDFIVLDNHVEASEEGPKKTKLFLVYAADTWDAEFYAKLNDDVYVNIALWSVLTRGTACTVEKDFGRIRCLDACLCSLTAYFMSRSHKWFEPEWWKFGDGKWSRMCSCMKIHALKPCRNSVHWKPEEMEDPYRIRSTRKKTNDCCSHHKQFFPS
ncbi:hypothetical protein BHE74_00031947 [Ensete ventricosum]|uniref:Hexosyltransferase n=1 Tax=Ensete ventricosum TaxID=4639 RepID=A0A426ZWH6_ENSVE|nr:hypothetical protein B296_00029690 [Ensete ventricosum]RWW60998.1 hypothetical protein BHE74_00031947 [Ensete ventricosum]